MNPFQTTPRKRLTDQQSAKLFLERGGKCEICGRKIRSGERWAWDHRISLENQGSNEIENFQLACEICHGAKTPADRRQAAKSRAAATRNIVPEATRQKSRLAKPAGMKYDWEQRRYIKETEA